MLYFLFFLIFFVFCANSLALVEIVFLLLLLTISLSLFLMKMASVSTMLNVSNQFFPLFMDWYSLLFIFLSFLIVLFSVFASLSHVFKKSIGFYVFFMLIILLFLFFFFSVWNMLLFFFMFEFVLLPMILIIVLFSSQSERLMANYYFFLYTIISGFPLLLSILYLFKNSFSFYMSLLLQLETNISFLFLLIVCLAFLCKLPIYGLHIWLPKAHVEAPVSGSMVLASLLLKMSGYSVMRVCLLIYVSQSLGFLCFVSILLVSMLYPMLICSRQNDIKMLIAYSSVGHMCVSVLGLIFFGVFSYKSGFVVFLSHGLISPGMFYLSNLLYERMSSRMVLSMGSLEVVLNSVIFYILLFFIANMSYPPFVSFFAELCIYFSLLSSGLLFTGFIFLFILVSGVVMFYYVSKIMKSNKLNLFLIQLNLRERFGLFGLFFFLLCMTPLMIVL